ncbi:MAG: DUF389 domain-containing protein [Actinobacteria bacterium]|jgi:uncharacterized hydrophobic protein (TIGR00271 family)|nr:DUF389 domain-containing protein [Actinomycetota bacterium]
MNALTERDVERMTSALFIDGPLRGRPSSRFWVLLVLAAIIATSGLVADSTATVIGAMIVAPLMTPILGVALAVVLADRRHLLRSFALVICGALAVIAIAYVISLGVAPLDAYASNTQVSGRISPRLIDLLAALATGTVGAFALVRSDISDTLPGVAIAISLVPPLAVVGMLLQVQRYADAAQAGLLFGTNVAAIIATGTIVLLFYRIRDAAKSAGQVIGRISPGTIVAVAGAVVIVAVPLAFGTMTVAADRQLEARTLPIAQTWAREVGWDVADVSAVNGTLMITALGEPPEADPEDLRVTLNDQGYGAIDLQIVLVIGGGRICAAGGTTCAPLGDTGT